MPRAVARACFRGEPITITAPVEVVSGGSPAGSPAWALLFTLVRNRNCATKVYSTEDVTIDEGASTITATVPAMETDEDPGKYWFDFWRTDDGEAELLAFGYLVIKPDARFPA